jgi:hypothetical protein
MEKVSLFISWCLANWENIAIAFVAAAGSIGALAEVINAALPTENKISALEKIGKAMSWITNKAPSNLKKKIEEKK